MNIVVILRHVPVDQMVDEGVRELPRHSRQMNQ